MFHTGLTDEKPVSWTELFFDLIFVAAIIQLGDALSKHVTETDATLGPLAVFIALFIPLWIAWTGFTFFANRFALDDVAHRLLVFLEMFAIGAMAISATSVVFEGHHMTFSLAFSVAQAVIAAMYARSWRQVPDARDYSTYWGGVFGVGALIWFAAAWLPTPWAYILWGFGIALVLYAPVSAESRRLADRYPIDFEHLGERYGLLTIIVLGESFVKVLSYLTATDFGTEFSYLTKASLSLLVTCSVWWIYFDDVAGSELKEGRGNWIIWLFGHLPLAVAITALGVAVKKMVTFDLGQPPDEAYRWLACAALALVFFSVAIIDSVSERHNVELSDRARINVRFGSALFVLLIGQIGHAMSAGLFLSIITALCLGQIIFDIMMAPFEQAEDIERAIPTSELARRPRAEEADRRRGKRRKLSETVRKGAPAELRRDLYFFFMEGSWARLFFALGFAYLAVNCIFAGLYLLQPGSISGVSEASFADAFAFSIQTMSTIGYGVMSPGTDYGDLIVAIEAAVALLGVALATGLMFAKASRPQSSVLFSKPMVLAEFNGKPTLMFRAGNARGNEVVEAEVKMSVLMDEITPEGEHIRRMRDLPLVRNRSPFFTLSWQVMHVLDEKSPLADVDWNEPTADMYFIAVTMRGFDVTYSQSTYARHLYMPFDVQVGHRFVDVISETEDGQMVIDFTRFHETEPSDARAADTS